MSVANGRNQDKRNLSIGRGRGKRSSQQKPTAAIQNDTHESKSESQSKVPDKAPSTRVSRGRGWKRPDQAIYIPKALRKDNPKDSNDRKVTEDANKQKGEDEVCRLKKEYDSIFSDSDSFLQQKGTNRQSLTRQYPEEEETAVSVASTEDQKNCDSLVEKGTEIPENISAKSSIENNLSNNEAASLDMNKPFNKSVIHEDCQEKKNISEKTKDEEEEREKVLRTEENTCGRLHVESIKKGKEEKLWKNESKIEIESASLDMCQSMSPVTSCVESDKEQEGQKLLEYQERRESTKLGQEKSVVDMCQSSSTVESVNVEVNTKDEKEVLLQVQEMQENIIRTEQQEYATTTKTTSSLELDLTIIEGEAEQKKKDDFLEKNELVAIENKREDQQTQRTEACQSSLTDTCQSITDAEVNNEIHNKHDINPQEGMHTTSLEQELKAAFDTGYEMDATNVEECLPKGSSKHDFNNVLMDLKDFNTDEVQIEDKTVCFKNEVINDQSSDTDKEVTSDTKDRIKKEEIPSQNTEGQKESQDFKIMEVQESTESDHVNNSSSVDLGNEEKEKMDADDVVNNEKKNDEKESKHKKKSKKKKEEKDSKEEKKKKKSKKKESEDGDGDGDGEPKEKENDEKRKLKKKEKKKASKEDAGTKCKESKSKEKAKDKKEKECKTGNEGNDDDAVDDDESWESKFNEDGECLDPELLEELTEVTGIKRPSKRKTQFDYYALPSKEVTLDDDSGYGHIVELYDFSPELKTQDLVQLLSSFKSQGYDIKWVDDTHALAVFSSEIAAKQAIQMCSSPIMKLRPVSQGTPESKSKAKNCFSFLQPYKPRPQTSKLAAHRLVTGALGVRSTMSKEEREKEREKIKEAKEQKRQEKQRKADIWGD